MTVSSGRRFPNKLELLLTVVLSTSAVPASAQAVYTQPTDYPHGSVYLSQNTPSLFGNGTTFDNFTLAQETSLTGATWQGQYFFGDPGDITNFTVDISGNTANNQPGAVLATELIAGNGNETAVDTTREVFNYSGTFSTPFIAQAGTTYWLSIVATINPQPSWYWHTGTGSDGTAVLVTNNQGFPSSTNVPHDMAFSLAGEPVPETSTFGSFGFMLLLGGNAALIYRRKRSA